MFDLVDCYRARKVTLNIETKVEAGAPRETAPREQFVQVVAREIRRARILDQVTIQSFDWGALMRMREVEPRLPIVALTNGDFLQVGQPGASPWLGGIDIDDFGGEPRREARPRSGPMRSRPCTATRRAARSAIPTTCRTRRPSSSPMRRARMDVIPWTVDDPATMHSLIDAGVDGLITDYPDRLRTVMAQRGFKLPKPVRAPRWRQCL